MSTIEENLNDVPFVTRIRKLSHKCFRALLKKFKRKKKRQLLAKSQAERELKEQQKRESSPGYLQREAEKAREQELWNQYEERERERKHKLWVLREEQAQIEFQRKKELQEQENIRKEQEKKKMQEEFEKQHAENLILEQSRKDKLKKEEALQEALSSLPEGNEPWHNPIAPENYNVCQEKEQCQFFLKTGCCRFGEQCSRGHIHPSVSCTLLIKGMYSHFSIGQVSRDDYDTDIALEFEDSETYQDFKNFYDDVLPEFKKFGRVVQFKVCSNHEPHLRGNVYVQYSRESAAVEAYKMFNGRYYAGKQLSCEFTNVIKWKSAICGLYHRNRCPKGNNCNFLHVFKNPGNEFWAADRDFEDRGYGNINRFQKYNSANSSRSHQNFYSPAHSRSYKQNRQRYNEHSTIDSYAYHKRYSKRSPNNLKSHKRYHTYSSDSEISSDEMHSKHKSSERRNRIKLHHKENNHWKKKSKHHSRSRSASYSPSSSSSSTDTKKHNHSKKSRHRERKSEKKRKKRKVFSNSDSSE